VATITRLRDRQARRFPLAAGPVTGIALLTIVALLALSPRYGYHRDELYFRLLGEHPAAGYFDTPPFTPMVARAATALFGEHVTALRVFPAICTAIVIVLAALVTRELGGGRAAQVLSAAGIATATLPLLMGHALLTLTTDITLWVAAILFTLRALLRGDGRWWLAVGAVAGVATYNRDLIALLAITLGAGLLLAGPRRALRDPWLWAGMLLALVIAAPNLYYQATHDWPQLQMSRALEAYDGDDNRVAFVPLQLVLLGPPLAVISVPGWLRLWRDRAVRSLAIAYPLACAVTLSSGGRPDYTGGFLILLYAAGCVPVAAWAFGTRPWRRTVLIAALAVSAVVSATIALPVLPASVLGTTPVPGINEVAAESVGWPEFAAQVAAVVRALPPGDREHAVFLAENYGEAGAVDLYADRYDLPPVRSGHNELWWQGPPPRSATVAVVVSDDPAGYGRLFRECQVRGHIDNGVGLDNEEQGLGILVCRDPVRPWTQLWPLARHYS
jgi:hypothetical protein